MESFMLYYGQFMELSKANPIVASVLATGVGGSLIMVLRGVPRMLMGYLQTLTRQSLVLEFPMDRYEYEQILKFVFTNGKLFCRNVRIRYMTDEGLTPSFIPGFGRMYWIYGNRLWLIDIGERDSTGTLEQKSSCRISVVGFTRKPITDMITGINKIRSETKRNNYNLYKPGKDVQERPLRRKETVILNEGVWDTITDRIDDFLASEEWYVSKGIPYKLNIMLAGPPGTGKSSIITAIASLYDANVSDETERLDVNDGAVYAMDGRLFTVVVMEDIEQAELFRPSTGTLDETLKLTMVTLPRLLNTLSGIGTPHGMVSISTSNDLSVLPEQLLRPSRMDLIVEIGYLEPEAIVRYIKVMYDLDRDLLPGTPKHRASFLQEVFHRNITDVDAFLVEISQPEPVVERKSYLEENSCTTSTP